MRARFGVLLGEMVKLAGAVSLPEQPPPISARMGESGRSGEWPASLSLEAGLCGGRDGGTLKVSEALVSDSERAV